jgi:hypothetical protein
MISFSFGRKAGLMLLASLGVYLVACGDPSGSNLASQLSTLPNAPRSNSTPQGNLQQRLRSASGKTPFLVSTWPTTKYAGPTVYLASANFKTLTPLVSVPTPLPTAGGDSGVIIATAVGPKGELFVSNCKHNLYGGLLYACSYGETDVYQSGSGQPTVIPNGGSGVAVAKNGRFVTVGNCGNGCVPIVSEFDPGTTTPIATAPPGLFCTGGHCNPLPQYVNIDSTGKQVYFYHEQQYYPYACVTGRFAWTKWTANFNYLGSHYYCESATASYIASDGTFYSTYESTHDLYVFAKGSSVPTLLIPTSNASGVVVYHNDIYVANLNGYPGKGKSHKHQGDPYIAVYGQGQTTPKAMYVLPWEPTALSLSNPW